MRGLWRRVCRHRWVLVVTIVAVLVGSTGTLWAESYDRHSSRFLPDGVVIGGVGVGGLRQERALDLLKRRVEAPLHTPVLVQGDGFAVTTTAWDLGWRVDVGRAIRQALAKASRGGLVSRVWRRLRGPGPTSIALRPRWVPAGAAALLTDAASATHINPVAARLDASSGWVSVVPDQAGRDLDRDGAIAVLGDGIERGDRVVTLPTKATFADVRAGSFASVILVRTGENTLHLYQGGQIVKSYPVATGTARYPTPTGSFRVVNKLIDPVWTNPSRDWSAHMPARIGPGPDNPLGSRALELSADGILIHATPDTGSIGFSASHGCVRMAPSDEADLFSRVRTGTPVVIVEAGPPKPRGSATPAPVAPVANPAQEAAKQF